MRTIRFKLTDLLWPEGQQWIDALRNTLCVLLPLAVFFNLDEPGVAIGVGTGALLVSLADLPGNRSDKTMGAWTSILVCWTTAVLISMSLESKWILCLLMTVIAFLFTMLACFGQRLAAVGAIGLLVASFTIGLHPQDPLRYGCYIAAGGIWYYTVSLLQVWLFPFHPLRRTIHRCKRLTVELLRLRAIGYDPTATLSGFNRRNIALHLKLSASHELIRKLLLGDRYAIGGNDKRANSLLQTSIILIDLYEKISAVHNEYPYLRQKLASTGSLSLIHETIMLLALELEGKLDNRLEVKENMERLAGLNPNDRQTAMLLEKLLSNLKQTVSLVFRVNDSTRKDNGISTADFEHFIQREGFSAVKLRAHLRMGSPILRFSLRLSFLMLISVLLVGVFPIGSYTYWLPLTVLVVSRPSFVHTTKRNIERMLGTFGGLLIGWAMVKLTASATILLSISTISIFIFFLFLYSRYWLAALGATLAAVLCLSVYHGNAGHILLDRLLFTLLGCALGMAATFFFPIWHYTGLKAAFLGALEANRDFLVAIENRDGDLKLARKEAYLALAVLSEGISLGSKEPNLSVVDPIAVRQLELLCYQCNGLISALTIDNDNPLSKNEYKNAITDLNASISQLKTMEFNQLKNKSASPGSGPLALNTVTERIRSTLDR